MKFTKSLCIAAAITLTGCSQNVMKGGVYSNVDRGAGLTKSSRILISAYKDGDVLTNKRYLQNIEDGFHEAGFENVSSEIEDYDFYLIYDYRSDTRSSTRDVPTFGTRNTGSATNCTHNAYGSNVITSCNTQNQSQIAVTGFNQVQVNTEYHVMQMQIGTPAHELVYDIVMVTKKGRCSKWKNFEFLTQEAFKRLDFNNPVDEDFKVEMPQGYDCG
ncbi:hypothetical protein [Marinomonas sp.]|uniref:hypothetical protein n=1 Tax=Marinomonas sp. TaxID=1904862 RepID=UPI003A9188B9